MGYGPTHPRIAVVITGDSKDALVSTLESVFSHSDMNRIFVVCVVVDGMAHDKALIRELENIDRGAIPHWHGLRLDLHMADQPQQKEEEGEVQQHGAKVHVLFNKEKRGVSDSRSDGVEFVRLLRQYYEQAGLKSHAEDLILLLMKAGAHLTSRDWIAPIPKH
jgi:hypothetical protein